MKKVENIVGKAEIARFERNMWENILNNCGYQRVFKDNGYLLVGRYSVISTKMIINVLLKDNG